MMKSIRRKLADAISPEKSNSYPFVELNWATPQSENRRILERAHKNFKLEHGRPAIDDAEAWKWDREQVHETLRKMGLEPSNPSTEFHPSLIDENYYEKENTPDSKNQR